MSNHTIGWRFEDIAKALLGREGDLLNFQNGNKWKAVLFLSVILPMSFLVTFKLSGLTGGSATLTETVVLEPAKWELERPSHELQVSRSFGATYANSVFVNQTVYISGYSAYGWGDSPFLESTLNMTVQTLKGHIETINVTYADEYLNSTVYLPIGFISSDLAQTSHKDLLRGYDKAVVSFKGLNSPNSALLFMRSYWLLYSPHNETQSLRMQIKVVYFDGDAFRELVQPFEIQLIADDANSFAEAKEIGIDQEVEGIIGGDADLQDCFKVFLTEGERVNVTMVKRAYSDHFGLYLFNPYNIIDPVCVSQTQGDTMACSLFFTVDVTGWWFIVVRNLAGCGFYVLTLS